MLGNTPAVVESTYRHWMPGRGREAVERIAARLDGQLDPLTQPPGQVEHPRPILRAEQPHGVDDLRRPHRQLELLGEQPGDVRRALVDQRPAARSTSWRRRGRAAPARSR